MNLPTGTLYGRHKSFIVQANGQLQNAAAYRPLIVAYRNGAPVRLEALGRVMDSVENNKTAAWYERANQLHNIGYPAPARAPTRWKWWTIQAPPAHLPKEFPRPFLGNALRPLDFHSRLCQRRQIHSPPDPRVWWCS